MGGLTEDPENEELYFGATQRCNELDIPEGPCETHGGTYRPIS